VNRSQAHENRLIRIQKLQASDPSLTFAGARDQTAAEKFEMPLPVAHMPWRKMMLARLCRSMWVPRPNAPSAEGDNETERRKGCAIEHPSDRVARRSHRRFSRREAQRPPLA
jgi:hypothetical protein